MATATVSVQLFVGRVMMVYTRSHSIVIWPIREWRGQRTMRTQRIECHNETYINSNEMFDRRKKKDDAEQRTKKKCATRMNE